MNDEGMEVVERGLWYTPSMEEHERQRNDASTEMRGVCPACGGAVQDEKCKVVCRSAQCIYRIVYNCAEY